MGVYSTKLGSPKWKSRNKNGFLEYIQAFRDLGLACAVVIALSLLNGLQYDRIRGLMSENLSFDERALNWQIQHPLKAIPADQFNDRYDDIGFGVVSHLRKRTYRVMLPLIAYALRLNVRQAERIGVLCSLGFCCMILAHFRRIFADPLTALYCAVAVACSSVGQWGTNMYTFYDGVGYLLLALAAYTRSGIAVAILLIAGGFSDERVILAAPLLYLYQIREPIVGFQLPTLFKPTRQQWGTLAGVALFVCLRILLGVHVGKLFDASNTGWEFFRLNLPVLQLALVLAYKGASILLLAGAGLLARKRPVILLLLAGCALPGVLGSVMIFDLTRSFGYTFIVLLFCAKVLAESRGVTADRQLALWAALASICMPTYYLFGRELRYFKPVWLSLLKVT